MNLQDVQIRLGMAKSRVGGRSEGAKECPDEVATPQAKD